MAGNPIVQNVQRYDYAQELLAYQHRGPAGIYTGEPARIRRPTAGVLWVLKVGGYTGDDFDAGLQVKLQTRLHDVWFSVALSSTFNVGNAAGSLAYKLSATEPNSVVGGTSADPDEFADGMVGGNVQHVLGEEWRVSWQVQGENPLTSFLFGCWLVPVG